MAHDSTFNAIGYCTSTKKNTKFFEYPNNRFFYSAVKSVKRS